MSMTILGIDPGKSGSVWAIDARTRKTLDFMDISKLGNDINIQEIVDFVKKFDVSKTTVFVENPHPHGNTGVKTVYAAFEYGKSVGIIFGIICALGYQCIRVSPATWKGHFAITGSKLSYNDRKNLAVEKACYLSPADAHHFNYKRLDTMVKRHDRAEAFLVAIYGLENHLISKGE